MSTSAPLALTETNTRAAFVDYLCRECGVDKVYRRFCLPYGSVKETVPYAMARVINVPRFLNSIAKPNPGFQLHIGIDGDMVLPENNGWYIVENGKVRLTDLEARQRCHTGRTGCHVHGGSTYGDGPPA